MPPQRGATDSPPYLNAPTASTIAAIFASAAAAVVLHGHLRTTADLDLIVQLERDTSRQSVRTRA